MTIRRTALMRISSLARAAGLPKSTVAYYARMGLLSRPTKTGRTMAYYDESHLSELRLIRKLRAEGTPIAFIRARMAQGQAKAERTRPLYRTFVRAPAAGQGRQREYPTRRREEIIEAASGLFLKKGFEQTSVADITDPLRIGRSTFYLYFRDKGELFLECIDSMFDSIFTSDMWDEIRQVKDTLNRLGKRAQITLKVSPEFFEILHLLRSYSGHESLHFEAKAREIYSRVLAPIKSDLERGIRQGVFRDLDPNLMSYVLLGAIEALSLASLHDEGYAGEEALRILQDFVARGLSRQTDDGTT